MLLHTDVVKWVRLLCSSEAVTDTYYRARAKTRLWMCCQWRSCRKLLVVSVLQHWLWNDWHVRHESVNCCQSGFVSGWQRPQQWRAWIPMSFSSFFSFHLFNLTCSVVGVILKLHRPETTSAFYDSDCRLTLNCLGRGHHAQEKTSKLKSKDLSSFYSFPYCRILISAFSMTALCQFTSWWAWPTYDVYFLGTWTIC